MGHESGNDSITDGRDIPWLQDTPDQDVWGTWGIAYRDVILVDPSLAAVDVVNLTETDLMDSANYQDLKQRLIDLESSR